MTSPLCFTAPAWDGDLASLTAGELDQRLHSLTQFIGSLHTVYAFDHQWRAATPAELHASQVSRWVSARLLALHERSRRETLVAENARLRAQVAALETEANELADRIHGC
jgi:hypothetical protein